MAAREGLAGLSVNRVVAEAGVAKGTFYVHFADREAFIDALHAGFHDRVQAAVAAATADTPPGAERLLRGAEAYLDVCLADRAIKALALEARTDAALTASMSARHEAFAASAIPSFRAMGWPDAKAAAQLLAAMTSEIAIRELEAGRRLRGPTHARAVPRRRARLRRGRRPARLARARHLGAGHECTPPRAHPAAGARPSPTHVPCLARVLLVVLLRRLQRERLGLDRLRDSGDRLRDLHLPRMERLVLRQQFLARAVELHGEHRRLPPASVAEPEPTTTVRFFVFGFSPG